MFFLCLNVDENATTSGRSCANWFRYLAIAPSRPDVSQEGRRAINDLVNRLSSCVQIQRGKGQKAGGFEERIAIANKTRLVSPKASRVNRA